MCLCVSVCVVCRRSVVDQRDLQHLQDHCCWCQSYAHELVRNVAPTFQFSYFSLLVSVISSGLSEEARADFRVMRDVAVYTRQKPQERTVGMKRFLDQINR